MIVVSDKLTTESFHAFIDEQLSDEQYGKVESLLDEIPEKIEEIQQCQIINERLREVFDAVVQEEIPDDLYQMGVHGITELAQKSMTDTGSESGKLSGVEQGLEEPRAENHLDNADDLVLYHDDEPRQTTSNVTEQDDEFADLVELSATNQLDNFEIDSINADEPGSGIIPDIFDDTSAAAASRNAPSRRPQPKTTSFVDTQTLQFMEALDLNSVGIGDENEAAKQDKVVVARKQPVKQATTKPHKKKPPKNINQPAIKPNAGQLVTDMMLEPMEPATKQSPKPNKNAVSSQDIGKQARHNESQQQADIFKTLVADESLTLEPLELEPLELESLRIEPEVKDNGVVPATPQQSSAYIYESDTDDVAPDFAAVAAPEFRKEREYRNLASDSIESEFQDLSDGASLQPNDIAAAGDAEAEWQQIVDEINSHAARVDTTVGHEASDELMPEAAKPEPAAELSSIDIGQPDELLNDMVSELEQDDIELDGVDTQLHSSETQAVDFFSEEERLEQSFEVNDVIKQLDEELSEEKKPVINEQLFSSATARFSQKIKNGIKSLKSSKKSATFGAMGNKLKTKAQATKPIKGQGAQAAQQSARAKANRNTKKQAKEYGSTISQLQAEFEQFQQEQGDKGKTSTLGRTQKSTSSTAAQGSQEGMTESKRAYADSLLRLKQISGRWLEKAPIKYKSSINTNSAIFVLVGVIIGAVLYAILQKPVTVYSSDAVEKLAMDAHLLYTQQDQNFVGESDTSITESLQWMSARIGRPISLADINVKGYKHKYAILIPTMADYAAVNIYENAQKQQMTLLVASNGSDAEDTPLKCRIPPKVDGLCAWRKDSVQYIVVASLSLTRVRDFSRFILDRL